MIGGFVGFIGIAIGLVMLILIWPKMNKEMRVVRGVTLAISLLLISNFLLAIYFLKSPTERMLRDRKEVADTARNERNIKECYSSTSAFTAANLEVKRRLKDPDSAKFPWVTDAEVKIQKITGTCTFSITSHVSAKNSFGAYSPQSFDAVVQYDMSSRSWRVIQMNM